jgi:Ca2+-binding EF-hand superfamily protein
MQKQSSVSNRVKSVLQSTDKEDREVNLKENEKLIANELRNLVKDIWKKYDLDHNGVLDMDELRNFVSDILNDVRLD